MSEVLDRVVELFSSGDVPAAIRAATFPPSNIPMAKWSLRNRVLAMLAGTNDARGFRQWRDVGRHVKKGSKAFYILGPHVVKDRDNPDRTKLIGFLTIPVFPLDSTEGDPMTYEDHVLPAHPLMDVAGRWGLQVRTFGFDGSVYGWTDGKRTITLCSPEEDTFFHELAHCADGRLHLDGLKGGQHWDQEVVAELSAAVLCQLVGKERPNVGGQYGYIKTYASKAFPKEAPRDAVRKACHKVLSRTCKAVELILRAGDDLEVLAPKVQTVGSAA